MGSVDYVRVVESENCWRVGADVFDPRKFPCGGCGLVMTRGPSEALEAVVSDRCRKGKMNSATTRALRHMRVELVPVADFEPTSPWMRDIVVDRSVCASPLGRWVPGGLMGTALVKICLDDAEGSEGREPWGVLLVDVAPSWLGGKSFWVNPLTVKGVTSLEVIVAATARAAAVAGRPTVYLSYFDPGNPRLLYKTRYARALQVWCKRSGGWRPFEECIKSQ